RGPTFLRGLQRPERHHPTGPISFTPNTRYPPHVNQNQMVYEGKRTRGVPSATYTRGRKMKNRISNQVRLIRMARDAHGSRRGPCDLSAIYQQGAEGPPR